MLPPAGFTFLFPPGLLAQADIAPSSPAWHFPKSNDESRVAWLKSPFPGLKRVPHSGIRSPQNGCVSCPHLELCLNNQPLIDVNLVRLPGAIETGLMTWVTNGRPLVAPKLSLSARERTTPTNREKREIVPSRLYEQRFRYRPTMAFQRITTRSQNMCRLSWKT